jgi:hypothetical protein
MKKTMYDEGGRPLYDDDLETIQAEAQQAATAVLTGLGQDCIVSGCNVGGAAGNYTVGPGLVYVGGELLRFAGASGVTLPASLVPSGVPVVYDERAYETGVSKSCIQEEFAVVGAARAGVPLHPAGGLTLQHVLRGAQWEIGDRKFSNLVVADYDASTGVGIPGTAAWGWAIDATLAGRVVVGLDPNQAAFDTIGKQGGEVSHTLTIPEMPNHDHTNGVSQARFAYLDGKNTVDSDMDSSTSEPNLTKTATVQAQGGSQPHNNLQPYTILGAKVWVGF